MQIIFKFRARRTNYAKEYHVKNFDYCLVDLVILTDQV